MSDKLNIVKIRVDKLLTDHKSSNGEWVEYQIKDAVGSHRLIFRIVDDDNIEAYGSRDNDLVDFSKLDYIHYSKGNIITGIELQKYKDNSYKTWAIRKLTSLEEEIKLLNNKLVILAAKKKIQLDLCAKIRIDIKKLENDVFQITTKLGSINISNMTSNVRDDLLVVR